jgi:hypothetical protein
MELIHASPGMPPVRLQLLASVEDHETVKVSPATTVAGLKEIIAVGGAGGVTVSVRGVEVTGAGFSGLQVTVMENLPDCSGVRVAPPCGDVARPNGSLGEASKPVETEGLQ